MRTSVRPYTFSHKHIIHKRIFAIINFILFVILLFILLILENILKFQENHSILCVYITFL